MSKAAPKLDHYAVLEFEVDTAVEEVDATAVKKAYRKVALKFHPDKGHVAGSLLFKRIQEAYETLSDELEKLEYDRWYLSYYKRRTVTAKSIEKERKLREKLIADFIYDQNEPERKKIEEEKKARDAEERRRRQAAEKERQRREEQRKQKVYEQQQREWARQEKLKQEAQLKERERLRKIQEAQRREQEVMERRREEERLRAEERRKQAELDDLQEKIRRATEQVKRQAREAYDSNTYYEHTEEDTSSDLPASTAQRTRKTHSLKEKIMRDRAKLRERRKRQQAEFQPASLSTNSNNDNDNDKFNSRDEYIEKVKKLRNEYQKSAKKRDEVDDDLIELEAKTERIRVSATRAFEQAKKKYEEKMKLVDIKLSEVKSKSSSSKDLNDKMKKIQFEFTSIIDRYEDIYGDPDISLDDPEDDILTGNGKSTSKTSTPQKTRSSRQRRTRTPRSTTKQELSETSTTADPRTPSSKEFDFKASAFTFDDIKSNLPKVEPLMFSFSTGFTTQKSETASKPQKTESPNTQKKANPGVDFFGSAKPTFNFTTSSSSVPSSGPSTATGDSKDQIPKFSFDTKPAPASEPKSSSKTRIPPNTYIPESTPLFAKSNGSPFNPLPIDPKVGFKPTSFTFGKPSEPAFGYSSLFGSAEPAVGFTSPFGSTRAPEHKPEPIPGYSYVPFVRASAQAPAAELEPTLGSGESIFSRPPSYNVFGTTQPLSSQQPAPTPFSFGARSSSSGTSTRPASSASGSAFSGSFGSRGSDGFSFSGGF